MLLESECQSLTRNALERIAALYLGKRENKYRQVCLQLATRVVASLVAVWAFQYLKDVKHLYTLTAALGILGFACETVVAIREA